MSGIKNKYSLQVVAATVLASGMILITNNGVADAVKVTEDASTRQLQKQPLAPPGPFGQNSVQDANIATVKQQQTIVAPTNNLSAPASPAAPNMPDFKQSIPALGVAAPVALKPVKQGIKQTVKIAEPTFQRAIPNAPQASQPRINPVAGVQPVAPATPVYGITPPTVTMPAPRKMPQFNRNMLMQHPMPQFRGHPGQLRAAPQIQQFKYIPLPVYQANYGHPQPPSFNANVPGLWVPQMNNK